MITERQKLILKAIIEEYVKTNEPVGSKILVERPEFMLDYSSATIRNEMAALEDLGYISKTHTSSGRVPSEEGYRLYVNEILKERAEKSEILENNFPLIDEIIERNLLSREEAIRESMSMIADLTSYTSIVMGPAGYNAKIKRLQFVSITDKYAVILMVTDKGNVESQKIIVPENVSPNELEKVINVLNDILYDCPINKIYEEIKNRLGDADIRDFINYYDEIVAALVRTFTAMAKDDYFVSGQSKMLSQPEFKGTDKVQDILRAIEKQEIVKAVKVNKNETTVKIGNDNQLSVMKDCTIITVPVEVKDGEYGTISVVGPIRMEYQKIIPLLEYIASNIKKII